MSARTLMARLGSPRLTVLFFPAMAVAALMAAKGVADITALVVPPLLLLLVNLGAAIVSNARFRADIPLLMFHLALLVMVALLVTARLVYFEGAVRLTAGTQFDGKFHEHSQGLLHGDGASRLRFSHEGLVEYAPDGGYPHTRANVAWQTTEGYPQMTAIGNDRPLELGGYRIFASRERGYSPIFLWQPRQGGEYIGTAHLGDDYMQTGSRGFTYGETLELAGGKNVWVRVDPDGAPAVTGEQEDLGSATLRHHLVLRDGDKRYELMPGDSIELEGGRLTYLRLSAWLGYRVSYDPTAPWLAATIIVGAVSLAVFYSRLWRRSLQHNRLTGVGV